MSASVTCPKRIEAVPALRRHTRFLISLFVPLLLSLLFSGCAATGGLDLPEMASWETRKAVLAEADEWEFTGRIGVSAGDEGFNGKLFWRQDGVVFRARIGGPLGMGTVFINGNRGELTVTDKDGVVSRLDDAEAELRQMYGWTIPLMSLRYWVLGIPDPAGSAETRFDADGQLMQILQCQWQVDYGPYRISAGQAMPRRLTAVNDDVKVRLIVDEWVFR